MRTALLLVPLVGAALGCAARGPLIPLVEEERARVAAAPSSVLVTVPWKKIKLLEFIYKVFWNEQKLTSYSIDGIWDPAPLLEKEVAEALKGRFNLDAKSLRASSEAGEGERLATVREKELRESVVDGWSENFLREPARAPFRGPAETGKDYFLEVGLVDLVVGRHSMGLYTFQIQVYGRLTRASDGVAVWVDQGLGTVSIEGMNSFADLEKDDLARMKRHYADAVKALCAPGNPFLQVFAPPLR